MARAHLLQRVGQRGLQARFALGQVDQLDFRSGELAVRGHHVEAAGRRHDANVGDAPLAQEHVVNGRRERALVDAGAGRGVALRIEVDQQHAALHRGQARRKIDGGRRLPDTALLVHDREDPAHLRLERHHDQVALRFEAGHGERRVATTRTVDGRRAISSSGNTPFIATSTPCGARCRALDSTNVSRSEKRAR